MKYLLKSIIIASAMFAASTAAFANGPCDNTHINLRNMTDHVLEVLIISDVPKYSTMSGPAVGTTIQPGETVTWIVNISAENDYSISASAILLLEKNTQVVHNFTFGTRMDSRFLSATWLPFNNSCTAYNLGASEPTDTFTIRNENFASMQMDLIAK